MLVYIRNENELCQLLGQLNYDKLILLRHEEIRNDILNLKWDIFNREFQFLINGKQINKLKEYKKALKCFENYSNNKRLYPSRKLKEKAEKPGYTALLPSSASMRRSWLYFATRSLRLGAPVLI